MYEATVFNYCLIYYEPPESAFPHQYPIAKINLVFLAVSPQISGMARQKVRPALQLISSSTATVIERFLPGKAEEARVIKVMDAACDVLNAINPRDKKVLRRGYCGSREQEEALTAALNECTVMRVGKSRHLYVFEKGLIVTIQSSRGLLADLRNHIIVFTW